MGLLQEIIAGATDGSTPVSQLLRSVYVLAVRGGAHDLGEWVIRERDGYRSGDPLPAYRGPFPAVTVATLTFGPSYREGFPLASTMFPDDFANYFKVAFAQSAVELEAINPKMVIPWPGEVIHYANTLIERGGQVSLDPFVEIINVHRKPDPTKVPGILDVIRNRVLDLALELEQVAPELDEQTGQTREGREKISAVFQTVVHAQTAYVGNNDSIQKQYHFQVTPGNAESLARYLEGISGLDEEARRELVAAAEAARSQGPEAIEKDGRLMAAMKKLGGATAKLGQEAASMTIKALLQHWLPPAA
jgi:AbiTii-like protein